MHLCISVTWTKSARYPQRVLQTYPALSAERVFRVTGVLQAETTYDPASLTHEVVAAVPGREKVGILRVPRQRCNLPERLTT